MLIDINKVICGTNCVLSIFLPAAALVHCADCAGWPCEWAVAAVLSAPPVRPSQARLRTRTRLVATDVSQCTRMYLNKVNVSSQNKTNPKQ